MLEELYILLFVLATITQGVESEKTDLCVNPDEAALVAHMSTGAAPKDGTDAGTYSQIKGVDDFTACVSNCCENSDCNAVFFSKKRCFTIDCFSDESCQPVDKQLDSILINLRSVNNDDDSDKVAALTDGVDSGEKGSSSSGGGHSVSCEIGLLECGNNEHCVPSSLKGTRAKSGVCSCKEGFFRNHVTQSCDPSTAKTDVNNSTTTEPSTDTTTAKANPATLSTTSPTTPQPTTLQPTTPQPTTLQPTVVTTITPKVIPLVVSAGESKVLQYPMDSVTLTAFVIPEPSKGETYSYHWSFIKHPNGDDIGHKDGVDAATLQLSKLVAGLYTLMVNVTGPNKAGSTTVNVTVLPEPKVNKEPVAVIKPTELNMKDDNMGILDGTDSTDDNGIEKYLWEIVSGPIEEGVQNLENNEGAMLRLKDLPYGSYTIRLTVTDKQGLKSSTQARVNVEKGLDYLPKADAGDDSIVYLPDNSVYLYGNASSDDKGIVSYEWTSKTGEVNVDIEGVHKPILHLTHLREGDYTFELEVMDTAGQKSTAEVHVFVKASENRPPVAVVANNGSVILAGTAAVLDGSHSSDDQLITSYKWTQISGPNKAEIDNADRPKANVEGLEVGDYLFKLTVSDAEELTNSALLSVPVREHSNEGPKAVVGKNQIVELPQDIVKLDGSQSTDDGTKLNYQWTKSANSPGAGNVLDNTDKQAVMYYADLVAGNYTFTLTVTDDQGLTDSSSVIVTVRPDPEWINVVEMSLDTPVESFTESNKNNLISYLRPLLQLETAVRESKIDVKSIRENYNNGKLVVLFAVHDYTTSTEYTVRNGTSVKQKLRSELTPSGGNLVGFTVSHIDTVVCQNPCSGHGHCDQFTKMCICDVFWMPNYAEQVWQGDSNCSWSVLYVVVILLGSIVTLAVIIWLFTCCARRCRRARGRRKHTYQLLQDIEQMENDEKLAKKKRNNISNGSGSIFLSETDMSSDEEDTLFMNGGNKHSDTNNLQKSSRDMVKANNLKNKLKA